MVYVTKVAKHNFVGSNLLGFPLEKQQNTELTRFLQSGPRKFAKFHFSGLACSDSWRFRE